MRLTILSFAIFALVAACAASRGPDRGGAGGDEGGGGTTDTDTDTDTTTDTGGMFGSGGKSGTGGKTGTGGAKSTGGITGAGGLGTGTGTGGVKGSGGVKGTGGSSPPTGNCADTTTFTSMVAGAYGGTPIPVTGTPGKSYYMIANWWGVQTGASEAISGLGFTINGVGSASSPNSNPMGFPSMFIGNYGGRATTGSNLPKQVSALTSIPTTFITNVDTKGMSQYNATYDVWFTQGSGVATNDPGPGGAFLMVWQFKPGDRYPRGQVKMDGHIVKGVPGAWSIWYDNTNPPCVSYVSSAKQNALNFDLVYFIKDAIAGGFGITNSQYLSIIFAGFEIWAGGDGLQVKNFCANVL